MKPHFLILLTLISFGTRAQNTGLEIHYSVNYTLSSASHRSFFGAGIGANVIFRDNSTFNIKTGLEVNYFHTWDYSASGGKMSSRTNLHYQYAVVSFPAFARLTFGERFKWFMEAGAYVGICPGGKVRYTSTSYGPNPGQMSVAEYSQSYRTGLSVTPAAALGFRFSLSDRLDLFLKPEFAFVKSNLGPDSPLSTKDDYGPVSHADFNDMYMYVRFCVGIHLKP